MYQYQSLSGTEPHRSNDADLHSSFLFAGEADSTSRQKSSRQQPIFRAGVCLSIPNIVMMPALEEIQQALNKAVEYVVNVSKGVGQWSKERISKVVLFLWTKGRMDFAFTRLCIDLVY